jgi:hypothetical protein
VKGWAKDKGAWDSRGNKFSIFNIIRQGFSSRPSFFLGLYLFYWRSGWNHTETRRHSQSLVDSLEVPSATRGETFSLETQLLFWWARPRVCSHLKSPFEPLQDIRRPRTEPAFFLLWVEWELSVPTGWVVGNLTQALLLEYLFATVSVVLLFYSLKLL